MARGLFRKRQSDAKQSGTEQQSEKLKKNLKDNLQELRSFLDNPNDLVIREFAIGGEANVPIAIAYMDGLIDRQLFQDSILNNLLSMSVKKHVADDKNQLFEEIYQIFISVSAVEKTNGFEDLINAILSGKTIFFLDGQETVLLFETKGGEQRSIDQAVSETTVRGPRTAFVESLSTNLILIRWHIQSPSLRCKTYQIGKRTKRSLVVDGVVNSSLYQEVTRRIETMDIDDAPESG